MHDITGTWCLVRARATAADGSPLPPPFGGERVLGRLVLTADGRMMSAISDGRPALPAGEKREYSSYCGNFTFDGRRLITRVDAASDPARLGTEQVRDVAFDGEILILRPPMDGHWGEVQQREIHWERIAAT